MYHNMVKKAIVSNKHFSILFNDTIKLLGSLINIMKLLVILIKMES